MEPSQVTNLEKRIASLEQEIFSLRAEFERSKRATPEPVTPQVTRAETTTSPVPAMAPPPSAKSATATAPPPVATADASFSWEWLIGGNIIGKIGIITLIVSTALFMVYALDQGWLSEWIRLLMLQGAFAALSLASYMLYRRQYKYVPEILAITALSANTIAIYSAHFVYRFLGRSETMVMMFALMSVALVFARRIRSSVLAMILFGGFFALPVIHSRGINEPKDYFFYLFAVNLLYLFLQFRRAGSHYQGSPHTLWVITLGNAISVFGWAGTYNQYSPAPLLFTLLSLSGLLYSAHTSPWPERTAYFFRPAAVLLVNVLSALMVAAVLGTNKAFAKEVIALAMLAIAAINAIIIQFLPNGKRHLGASALIVVLLMSVGISIILNGQSERMAHAILLTAAMLVAAQANDRLLFTGIATANAINLVALLGSLSHGNDQWFLLNFQFGTLLFYTIAAILLRSRNAWPAAFGFGPILTGVALLASFVGVVTELQRIITGKDARLLMLTLVFASYALLLLAVGFRQRKVWFRQAGLFFMGLAIAKFYLVDIWQWDKSVRIIAGIIMGGGLVLISFYYEKFRNKFRELGTILVIAGLLLPVKDAQALEKFRPNRYKFVKELALQSDSPRSKTYGSAMVDAELYKSAGDNDLRLVYKGKIVPYARQMKKRSDTTRVEKEIPLGDLVASVDGENTSVYVFENPDRIRINGLKIAFAEKDFNREVAVYQRPGRLQNNVLAKSTTLTRKAGKPEIHTIDFPVVSGEIQLQVKNEDDEPLTLAKITAVSDKEYLVFRIPEKFAETKEPLKLYYGAEYAQKPKYDINEAIEDDEEFAKFDLLPQAANTEYRLTLFDPPYSVWIFRSVFWLLLSLIAWRMYSVYKKEQPA